MRQPVLQAETFRRAKERTIARLKLPAEYSDTDFVDFLAQGELVAPRRPNDAALNEGHFFVPLGQTKEGQVVVRAGADELETVRLAAALRSLKTTTSEQELVEIVQLGLAELKRRDSKFLSEESVGAAPPVPALPEGLASEQAPPEPPPATLLAGASPGTVAPVPPPAGSPVEASPGAEAPEPPPASPLAEASPGLGSRRSPGRPPAGPRPADGRGARRGLGRSSRPTPASSSGPRQRLGSRAGSTTTFENFPARAGR